MLQALGNEPKALETVTEAVAIFSELTGKRPGRYATALARTLLQQAALLAHMARHGEALAAIDPAVQIYRRLSIKDRNAYLPSLAAALTRQADELGHLDRITEARAAIAEAEMISSDMLPSTRSVPLLWVSAQCFWVQRGRCDPLDSRTTADWALEAARGRYPMRSEIKSGGIFPDYALPDHTGTVRTLSELQGRDPLILTLARGNYCPKEHQQHLELAANYPKIAVAYTQIATIATDDHHTLQEFRASVGAQWTFLSDPGRTVQKDLDIQEYTDPEHDPMIPHTLVLKPGLVIHSIYNGYWFWGRPSFYDLWGDLRAATSEIRPDWDLSTPGLRGAWNAGDYSQFHGWDQRSPESTPTSYA